MAIPELPAKSSSDLYLVVATQEELRAQQLANSAEWRGALSVDAYFRREDLLNALDFTKDGGFTAWMLVYQPDPTGPRHVLCGCETLAKKALVGNANGVADVTCHGVASVFCPPKYRGKGYASRLMAEVGKRLKTWHPIHDRAPPLFSVLYSDIGKDFYAAHGWRPFPSAHIHLPPASTPTPTGVRLLGLGDLEGLCAADEQLLRRRLSQSAQAGRTSIAVVPDIQTLQWHLAKEKFVSAEINDGRVPAVHGALVGEQPGSRVWAYWTRVWTNPQEETPNTLFILRLVVEDDRGSDILPATPEDAAKLHDSPIARAIASIFAVARTEASEWNMKSVQIWNPSSVALAAAQSILPESSVVHREKESIASVQWYGEGSWTELDWVCNEKYGWC